MKISFDIAKGSIRGTDNRVLIDTHYVRCNSMLIYWQPCMLFLDEWILINKFYQGIIVTHLIIIINSNFTVTNSQVSHAT